MEKNLSGTFNFHLAPSLLNGIQLESFGSRRDEEVWLRGFETIRLTKDPGLRVPGLCETYDGGLQRIENNLEPYFSDSRLYYTIHASLVEQSGAPVIIVFRSSPAISIYHIARMVPVSEDM